jgi:AraC-like DNA-binding protein
MDVLSKHFLECLKNQSTAGDQLVQYALQEIVRSNGNVPLKELLKQVNLSERTLERKFKESVGVSPKLFSRICQFQATLSHLRDNSFDKLSDVAFANDYADQSHFIRVFREFTGLSPLQYVRNKIRLIEH